MKEKKLPKKLYIVLVINEWSSLQSKVTPEANIQTIFPTDFGIGFIPVFTSKKEANKHYPKATISLIIKT